MAKRCLTLLTCLAVLASASCSRPAAPLAPPGAAAGVPEPAAAPVPACSVESAREHKLDDGTELRVWTLKVSGLKRLTARLLIATGGKAQPANEVEYVWDKWEPTTPAASGQLVLLVQDGRAFGAKGRRLPLLEVSVDGSPSHARTGRKAGLFVEGELQSRMTSSSHSTPLGARSVLYSQVLAPKGDDGGTVSLSSDPESVAAASKGGRTVVAVVLEWAPQ